MMWLLLLFFVVALAPLRSRAVQGTAITLDGRSFAAGDRQRTRASYTRPRFSGPAVYRAMPKTRSNDPRLRHEWSTRIHAKKSNNRDGEEMFRKPSSTPMFPLLSLPVDRERMLGATSQQRIVEFLAQISKWQRPQPNSAEERLRLKSDVYSLGFHRLLRFVPVDRIPVDTLTLDPLDHYWLYKAESVRIPHAVASRAGAAVQAQLVELQKQFLDMQVCEPAESVLDDFLFDDRKHAQRRCSRERLDLDTSLSYKKWERLQLHKDERKASLPDCSDRVHHVRTVLRRSKDPRAFPEIFTALHRLGPCEKRFLEWDMNADTGFFQDPWPLLYSAERYFAREHVPRSLQLEYMGQLVYMIYQYPWRTLAPLRPWPADILMLLERYLPMEGDPDDSPGSLWVQFVLKIQTQFRDYLDMEADAWMSIENTLFYRFRSLDRGLHRLDPEPDHVLELYNKYMLTWQKTSAASHLHTRKKHVSVDMTIGEYVRLAYALRKKYAGNPRDFAHVLDQLAKDAIALNVVPDWTQFFEAIFPPEHRKIN